MTSFRFVSVAFAFVVSVAHSESAEAGWTRIFTPGFGDIEALVSAGDLLYAGSGIDSKGVFLSTDGGRSWSEIDSGLSDLRIRCLASLGSDLYAGSDSGIFRTSDTGQTWIDKSAGLASKAIRGMAAVGADLFAGTTSGGFYVSHDRGDTWLDLSAGIDSTAVVTSAAKLGSALVIGTSKGPYLTRDNGVSWQGFALGGKTESDIRSAVSSGNAFFLGTSRQGLYRSSDTGRTWSSVADGLPDSCINVLVDSDKGLFAGTETGPFLSVDGGDHWISPEAKWRVFSAVRSIAVQGSTVFAGTIADGLYFSRDGDEFWDMSLHLYASAPIYTIHATDSNLFAGTYTGGIYRSDLLGTDWKTINTGLDRFSAIEAIWNSGRRLLIGTRNGIMLSDDNGAHWESTSEDSVSVTAFAGKGANLYAWDVRGRLLVSSDTGRTWGLRVSGYAFSCSACFLEQGNRMFAGIFPSSLFDSGVSRQGILMVSEDSGRTWSGSPVGSYFAHAMTNIGNRIFLATDDGVFRNAGGDVWTRLRPDLVDTSMIDVASAGTRLFAMTHKRLFTSDDSGATWRILRAPDTETFYWGMTVVGRNLLVRTGNRTYLTPLDAISTGVAPRGPIKSDFVANLEGRSIASGIRFSFDLPRPEHATLRLYDLSGRELATLIDASLNTGSHEVIWSDARTHGPVFATLRAGNRLERIRLAPRW